METINNLDVHFTVKDATQTIKTLPLTSPITAKETLGVFLAPDGSQTTQVEYLKNKTTQWAEKIRTHHISPHNALLSIHTTILSTLRYPAPAMSLSKQEWHEITTPMHQIGLQAAGFTNKIPKAIRHGTTENLGLQIPCMYKTQGILKTMKYLTFITSDSILGKMLRLCEETIKLELGLPGNLYSTPYSKTHFLTTQSWIKNLWEFTSTHNITLQDHSPPLHTSSNKDKFIMEICLQNNLPRRDLININKCRKFLKVLTVADIITGDGKYIIASVKQGQRSSAYTSNMTWPNQRDPGHKAWASWRKAIRNLLEYNSQLMPTLQPSHWKEHKQKTLNWYYNRRLDKLFQRTNDSKWNYFTKIRHQGRRRRLPLFYYQGKANSLPTQSTPATTIYRNGHLVQFTGTLPLENPEEAIPQHTNLPQYIASIPFKHHHPLTDLSYPEHIPHILESIQAGNCAVVTDGSFFPSSSQGAAAYVVGNEAAHRRLVGRCYIAGPISAYSAYRAELAGIHGGLLLILGLCTSYNIEKGRIILGCDSKGALSRIQKGQIKLQDKHFDYISAIITILKKLPITVNFIHVAGHKDKIMALDQLSILENMNVQAHTHAKLKAAINPPLNFHSEAEILHEWAPVKIRNHDGTDIKIHSNFDKELYKQLTIKTSREYWKKNENTASLSNCDKLE